jgi:hypothetical protein
MGKQTTIAGYGKSGTGLSAMASRFSNPFGRTANAKGT